MADNPWLKYGASPWVLMIGSGEIGDWEEDYEGFGKKAGRKLHVSWRPWAVAELKLLLDHLLPLGPRLIRDPKTVRDKYDFYFGSNTDNRVRIFQHTHGLAPDGIVGKGTMVEFWALGRDALFVRQKEKRIRDFMHEHISMNLASYTRVH